MEQKVETERYNEKKKGAVGTSQSKSTSYHAQLNAVKTNNHTL